MSFCSFVWFLMHITAGNQRVYIFKSLFLETFPEVYTHEADIWTLFFVQCHLMSKELSNKNVFYHELRLTEGVVDGTLACFGVLGVENNNSAQEH